MSFDNAYEAITEENDARWAFGTGFDDPLAGVDTTLPSTVDGGELAGYCLMLADDALIMSHRLQEWCTRAPELEDEVAIANIGLDLLGQARFLLSRAAAADGGAFGEDEYAFFRDESQFHNVRLVEIANGDFAHTMARLLVFSTWRLALLVRLVDSADPVIAAIAAKGVNEVTYHRDYAARWVVRLGDGTPYSHERMREGIEAAWPLVDELFLPHELERRMAEAGVGLDPSVLRPEFDGVLDEVLRAATLERPRVPALPGVAERYGRHGVHTEAMGYLLAELQSVRRAHHVGARW
jgi:ring-1,2-phenylacetyl-CoA epoxidase subunit PaaC